MIPVVEVIEETLTQFIIKCPYCDKKHYHGKMEGERVSHCHITKKNKKLIDERVKLYESNMYEIISPKL